MRDDPNAAADTTCPEGPDTHYLTLLVVNNRTLNRAL